MTDSSSRNLDLRMAKAPTRTSRVLATVGCTVALLLGTTSLADAATLRLATPGDVATLDPYAHTESFTSNILSHVYEPLVRRSKTLEIEPALATEWERVSDTTYRFSLRDGVTFHNGNPFTADDVVASIERLKNPDARAKGNAANIDGVRKIDDLTVEIDMAGPYPLLLNDLTGIFMMDEEWMEANDALAPGNITTGTTTYASTNAMGTGPFMLDSYAPDQRIVLLANPDWWDTAEHNLDEVVITPIQSDATRVAALLSGEVDLIFPTPLQDVARIEAAPGFKVIEEPALRLIMLGLNHGADELHAMPGSGANPLKDVRVRRAVAHAIDMDAIRDRIMRGKSRNTGTLVAPPVPGYDEANDERMAYDPDMAKSLLTEAGFPDGFTVGLDCPNDRYVNDEAICVAISGMLAQAGIETDLTTQTKANHFPKVDNGETDMYMIGWATLPPMDGYSVLSSLLATREEGSDLGGNNPNGFSNARVDELAKSAAVELDEAARVGMLQEALAIAREEVAYIPLHQQPLSWAAREGVEVTQYPDEFVRLWWDRVAE